MCTSRTILRHQGLKEVPENVTSSETYLDISYNEIIHIKQNAFWRLALLRLLYINRNKISTIAPGAFNGLFALKHLHLFGNRISSTPNVSNLSSLVTLKLARNPICDLNLNHFGNHTKLEQFYCIACKLQGTLSLPTFRRAYMIFLDNNQIKSLTENVFEGFISLKYVYLSYNKLGALPELGVATGTIAYLQLSRNIFYHFPSFRIFSKLTSIDLSWNYITSVSHESLPTTITTLNLKKNPIECLSGHCWTTSQEWMNKFSMQCADGKALEGVQPEVLCQGKWISEMSDRSKERQENK